MDNFSINNGNFSAKQYIKDVLCGMKKLLKNPKKLIMSILPALIVSVFWVVLSLLEAFGVDNVFIRILSAATYAQGGMFGGFFGAVGGILGKALFAYVLCAIVSAIINKQKINYKGLFKGFSVTGLMALGYLLVGGGIATLFYVIFNITSSTQNIMIAAAGVALVTLVTSSGGGLVMWAVCGV